MDVDPVYLPTAMDLDTESATVDNAPSATYPTQMEIDVEPLIAGMNVNQNLGASIHNQLKPNRRPGLTEDQKIDEMIQVMARMELLTETLEKEKKKLREKLRRELSKGLDHKKNGNPRSSNATS